MSIWNTVSIRLLFRYIQNRAEFLEGMIMKDVDSKFEITLTSGRIIIYVAVARLVALHDSCAK